MISIIIPIYNAEKYLMRCISSVVSQSYSNIEVILVNDGSTDGSLSVCESLVANDDRIKIISQKNGGVSKARNAGIALANGDYIMFVDSDDYMLPNMCEVMLDTLKSKQTDCVICGVKETGNGLWCPELNMDYKHIDDFNKDFTKQLATELLSPCWNKIFKKELITNLFNEKISFGEDLIFCLQYFKNCSNISFIKQPLIFHEKGISDSLVLKVGLGRLLDIEDVHRAIIDFDGKNVDVDIHKKYLRDLSVYSRMLLKNKSMSFKEKKNILDEWHRNSFLKNFSLSNISDCLSNRLLFFFLKYKFWSMADILVNKKIR